MTAVPIPAVAEPFIRLRARAHLDRGHLVILAGGIGRQDPGATRYDRLSFADAIAADLRVMDPAAFILSSDHGLTLHVFDAARAGAMRAIVAGEAVGTKIT
jgi:uridylate kinase